MAIITWALDHVAKGLKSGKKIGNLATLLRHN